MRLSKEIVEKFQLLHREKYGEEIGYEIAESQLNELADLVRMTAQQESKKDDKSIHGNCQSPQTTPPWRLQS